MKQKRAGNDMYTLNDNDILKSEVSGKSPKAYSVKIRG